MFGLQQQEVDFCMEETVCNIIIIDFHKKEFHKLFTIKVPEREYIFMKFLLRGPQPANSARKVRQTYIKLHYFFKAKTLFK